MKVCFTLQRGGGKGILYQGQEKKQQAYYKDRQFGTTIADGDQRAKSKSARRVPSDLTVGPWTKL